MPNNVINKVVYGDRTLIDLTDTTADAADVASGKYFYAKDGVKTLGTGSIGSDNGDVYQDEEGYIVLKPGAGTNVSVTPLSVTENGTYSAPTGVAYSPVTVDVEQGAILPTYTVYWDDDTGELDYVICDMTYTEIMAIMGDNYYCDCFVKESQDDYGRTFGATCSYDPYSDDYKIVINVMSPNGVPYFVIHHFPNDTKTVSLWDYNDSSDMYVLDNYIYAKSGYYLYDEGISMPSAPQATPTIAFSSNGLITATAVQASGYVPAGTETSTYSLTTRSAADMTVNGSYVTAPSGYYSQAFSKAVSLGTLSIREVVVNSNTFTFDPAINSSTGVISYRAHWATYYSDITSFSSGYISSAPSGSYTVDMSGSKALPILAATTYTPTTTAQTISSYQWLTGSQTILGDADLVPSNIRSGVSIFNVEGTMTEGPDVIEVWSETSFTLDATGEAVLPESLKMIPPVGRGIEATIDNVLHHVLMVQMEDDDDHSNFKYRLYSEEAKTNLLYISFNENLITSRFLTANSTHTIKLEYHLSTEKETLAVLATDQTVSIPFSEFGEYYLTTPTTNTEISVFSGCELELTINGETHIVGFGDFWVEYATCEVSEANLISSSGTTYAQVKLSKLSTPCTLTYSASIIKYDELVAPHGTIYVPLGKTIDTTYIKYARAESPYLQYKSVIPSSISQNIYADTGYDGLDEVYVQGDSNLIASNIRSGISIFGVSGTMEAAPIVPSTLSVAFYGTSYEQSNWSITYESSIRTSSFSVKVGDSIQIKYLGSESSVRLLYGSYGETGGYIQASAFDLAIPLGPDDVTLMLTSSWISIVGSGASVYDDIPFTREINNSVFPSFNIPNRITHLGKYALASVKSLYNVIGDNVWAIEPYTFYNTQNLSTASFPKVLTIGYGAFQQCYYLSNISIPLAFLIGESAFYSCSRLKSLIAPNVTQIGTRAFYSCLSLSSISFPNAIYVNNQAFYNCVRLNSVNFPNCVSVGDMAFAVCSNLSIASFPLCEYVGSAAFASLKSLWSVYLPNCITISQTAFRSCTSLSTIDLPKCETIGSYAFTGCSLLTIADFPKCKSIGSSAFMSCFSLENAIFSSCTSIYYMAFSYCSALSSISFPVCTDIGSYAFYRCFNLPSVYFPVCSSIGSYAFATCSTLSIISFPVCKYIHPNAFQTCQALTSVSFPNCTSIGSSAFYSCASLSIAIFSTSSGNTWSCNIYSNAFYSCSVLSKLYLLGSSIYNLLSAGAFWYTPISNSTYLGAFGSIYVPESLYSSYRSATNWVTYSSRFVSMTDAEIAALLS